MPDVTVQVKANNPVSVVVAQGSPIAVGVDPAKNLSANVDGNERVTVSPGANAVDVEVGAVTDSSWGIEKDNYYTKTETDNLLGDSYTAEAEENIKAGQVLYIKNNGHVALAKADGVATSRVVGVANADCNIGVACEYVMDGKITLTDWTNVIGSSDLTVGSVYYLDPNNFGKLTTTAPTTVGQYVVKVGQALTAKTLEIEIEQRILL